MVVDDEIVFPASNEFNESQQVSPFALCFIKNQHFVQMGMIVQQTFIPTLYEEVNFSFGKSFMQFFNLRSSQYHVANKGRLHQQNCAGLGRYGIGMGQCLLLRAQGIQPCGIEKGNYTPFYLGSVKLLTRSNA